MSDARLDELIDRHRERPAPREEVRSEEPGLIHIKLETSHGVGPEEVFGPLMPMSRDQVMCAFNSVRVTPDGFILEYDP